MRLSRAAYSRQICSVRSVEALSETIDLEIGERLGQDRIERGGQIFFAVVHRHADAHSRNADSRNQFSTKSLSILFATRRQNGLAVAKFLRGALAMIVRRFP